MRILVAPDGFGSSLDAAAAAAAIAAGWRAAAPADDLDLVPLSDGGPGFVAAVHTVLGGQRQTAYVSDPLRRQVRVEWLLHGDTAWVESAQACGLHLLADRERDPRRTSTLGVGELLLLAAGRGARTVIVGLGGSATNDGGAGTWAALGAEPAGLLSGGGGGLPAVDSVTVPQLPLGVDLVAATDVDIPLLGPAGASSVFGPQKGADRAAALDLDDALRHWADIVEPATGDFRLRDQPGAGAAGGLGFGLMALGARRVSGAGTVIDAVGLRRRVAGADLVVTGEGRLDSQTIRGKLVSAVVAVAREHGVPCVVVAGEVAVGEREAAAWGIDAAYSVAALAGSVQAGIASGGLGLQVAASQAAGDWSRSGPPAGKKL